MYTRFLNIFKTKKGFTMVEIFICVTVLGILTAVAVPIFTVSLKKRKQEDCNNQKQMISTTVKEAMAGMMDSGKAQSKIRIKDAPCTIVGTHIYNSDYLVVENCTLGDIRGGYRASDKVDASNTTNTYDKGCEDDHYLKKFDMKDTELYKFFSNQELPRCPFDDDGTKGYKYIIDENGDCFCTYCDADNITEPSTSAAS